MKFLIYLIIILIICIIYIRSVENSVTFAPSRRIMETPKDIGLSYEDVYFNSASHLKLNGWFIPSSGAQNTLLFFHGNAGNIGDRLEKIEIFHHIGLNIFIFDYRGYGNSQGKPSERGMYEDGLAAYDYLIARNDVNAQNIIGYGASLGGSAAVNLASQRQLKALIVDSSFPSAADMAKYLFPVIPSFVFKTKLDSTSKITNLTMPKLFIHSQDDETVPFKLGKKLYELAPQPKEFLQMRGGHNDSHAIDQPSFIDGISQFIAKYAN